jgi:hypothetical protein
MSTSAPTSTLSMPSSNSSSVPDPYNCSSNDRHCHTATEVNFHNIFNRTDDNNNASDNENKTTAFENNDDTNDDNDCIVPTSDNNGSYTAMNSGNIENQTNSTAELIVQFQYQVQTSLSVPDLLLGLPSIEKAMSDILVRDFFSSCSTTASSSNSADIRSNNRHRYRRRGKASHVHTTQRRVNDGTNTTVWYGLMMSPEDRILPGLAGVTCHTELVSKATSCFTVGGAYTVIGNGENLSSIESSTKASIRYAMEQKQLNRIHNEIYDISYISDDTPTNIPESSFGRDVTPPTSSPYSDRTNSSSDGRDTVFWPWIVASIGLILLGMIIYIIYINMQQYRRRRNGQRGDQKPFDIDSYAQPPLKSSYSPDSRSDGERQSIVQHQISNIVSTTEYGPFVDSFPSRVRSNDSSLDPYLHEVIDVQEPYVNDNINQWDYDNPIENLPIDHLNTSNDTEFYYNSIASSSNYGSGSNYDMKGHFPSDSDFA